MFAILISNSWAGGKTVSGLKFELAPPKSPCLYQPFQVWQEPDPFFKDLKQIKTKGTLHYKRDHNVVTNFPESTTVSVMFSQGFHEFGSCTALKAFDPAKIKFRVEWKNDSQIVPAKGNFAVSEDSERTWCEDSCTRLWIYELRIDSQNMSLADRLIIRIDAEDGTPLAEYVGKLSTSNIEQPLLTRLVAP